MPSKGMRRFRTTREGASRQGKVLLHPLEGVVSPEAHDDPVASMDQLLYDGLLAPADPAPVSPLHLHEEPVVPAARLGDDQVRESGEDPLRLESRGYSPIAQTTIGHGRYQDVWVEVPKPGYQDGLLDVFGPHDRTSMEHMTPNSLHSHNEQPGQIW